MTGMIITGMMSASMMFVGMMFVGMMSARNGSGIWKPSLGQAGKQR
jgi:hypothetical protein